MLKLYELSEAMNTVAQMMEEGAEGLDDILAGVEMSFAEKVESIIKLMKAKQAEQAAIEAERDRLDQRAKKAAKAAEWLMNYVEREMRKAEMLEVKSHLFKIKMGMTPPRVEVINQDLIPEKYMRYKMTESYTPDKMAIKEAAAAGETIQGVEIKQDLKLKIS